MLVGAHCAVVFWLVLEGAGGCSLCWWMLMVLDDGGWCWWMAMVLENAGRGRWMLVDGAATQVYVACACSRCAGGNNNCKMYI